MKKAWKKCLLPALLAAALLTVCAGAEEMAAEQPAESAGEPELIYFNDPYIDLSREFCAEPLEEVSLAGEDGAPSDPYERMKWDLKEAMKREYENNGGRESQGLSVTNYTSSTMTASDLGKLYYNTLYDYPEETYFAQTGFSYYGISYAPGKEMYLRPMYYTGLDGALYRQRIDKAAGECFLPGMTDLEKIVAAHDWLVLNCQYDPYVASGNRNYTTADGTTYTNDRLVYTSYGAFVEGNSVCQGYALAFKALMNRADVPCFFVNGEGHAWNMVELDGAWYYVDVTWDDPVNIGSTGDFAGMVERDDFLKGEKTFQNSLHQNYAPWTTEYDYPVSAEDCGLPAGLAGAQRMAAYLIDGAFYLADSSGNMYRYEIGGGFQNAELAASGLPTSIRAAALDAEENVLYFLSNYTSNWEGTEYWWRISELDLNEAEPAVKLKQYTEHTSERRSYGLKIRENPDIPGTKELCTWYDYAPAERIPIGLDMTDESMPVVIRYSSSMTRLADLAGKGISVSAARDCAVYLACYDGSGRMLHAVSLGTVAGGTETVLEVGASAVAEGTASAQIITLDSGTGKPLSSPVRSARADGKMKQERRE